MRFSRFKGGIQRCDVMGVQIIDHQGDAFGVREMNINDVLCIVSLSASVSWLIISVEAEADVCTP
jgi:hypothetical protein